MFKLDDNFLIELGLGALPPGEKNKMLSHIYETLEMKVGMRLAEKMSNEQLDEFEGFINKNDEQGALTWLESNFPNYKQVVAEELDRLKAEIRQVAPQILAQASGGGVAPGAPGTQPGALPPAPAQQPAPASYQSAPPMQPQPMPGADPYASMPPSQPASDPYAPQAGQYQPPVTAGFSPQQSNFGMQDPAPMSANQFNAPPAPTPHSASDPYGPAPSYQPAPMNQPPQQPYQTPGSFGSSTPYAPQDQSNNFMGAGALQNPVPFNPSTNAQGGFGGPIQDYQAPMTPAGFNGGGAQMPQNQPFVGQMDPYQQSAPMPAAGPDNASGNGFGPAPMSDTNAMYGTNQPGQQIAGNNMGGGMPMNDPYGTPPPAQPYQPPR